MTTTRSSVQPSMAPPHHEIYSNGTPHQETPAIRNTTHIVLLEYSEWDFPIATFEVTDALECGLVLKNHSLHFGKDMNTAVHAAHQNFAAIPARTPGRLALLDGVAHNRGNDAPFSVFALLVKGDSRLRWFWSIKQSGVTLTTLEKDGIIKNCRLVERHTDGHKQLFFKLTTLFEYAVHEPASEDFKKASTMTDYSCHTEDPDTAFDRVMTTPYIYYNAKEPFADMEDDRHLLELEPAKRLLASMLHISAAKYLLVKRQYFKAFFRLLILHRDQIPVPTRTAQRLVAAETEAQARRDKHIVELIHQQRGQAGRVVNGQHVDDHQDDTQAVLHEHTQLLGSRESTPLAIPSRIVVLKYDRARGSSTGTPLSQTVPDVSFQPVEVSPIQHAQSSQTLLSAESPEPNTALFASSPAQFRNDTPARSTRARSTALHQHISEAEAARQYLKVEEEASTLALDVPTPKRPSKVTQVRNDKNHIDNIRALTRWTYQNSRLLQEGWKAMGLFKEEKYVDWIDAGGMFETIGME